MKNALKLNRKFMEIEMNLNVLFTEKKLKGPLRLLKNVHIWFSAISMPTSRLTLSILLMKHVADVFFSREVVSRFEPCIQRNQATDLII